MSQQPVSGAMPPVLPQMPVPVIPYAAPSFGAAAVGGAWRDGKTVVLFESCELPDSCVKCGGPPETRLKRNLSWFPPVAYFGLLLGLLPFAILAIVLQKKATVMVPLCSQHLQKRKRMMLTAWCLSLGGLAVAIGGSMITEPSVTIPLGIALFIAGLVVASIALNPLKPSKIEKPYVYLKGGCAAFLNQLPDVRQPAPQPQA